MIDKIIDDFSSHYKYASEKESEIFREWVEQFEFPGEVLDIIIKNDDRTTYRDKPPTPKEYKKIYYKHRPKSYVDKNSLDYVRENTKNWMTDRIIAMCKKIREKDISEWENKDRDFIHEWEALAVEQEHAKKHFQHNIDIQEYLEIVKKCLIAGERWERPWTSERKMKEFTRSYGVREFKDIKGVL